MATAVTVTGTFTPGKTASLAWQLSGDLFDSAGQLVHDTAPVPVTLANGTFSSPLVAVDDSTSQPQGLVWTLAGMVDGRPFAESFQISHTMAPTVDISTLTPAEVDESFHQYALASALVAETARAEAAEAGAALKANNLSDLADAGRSRNNLQIAVQSAVAAVATSNVNIASPGGTFDGYAMQAGDELLLAGQTTASQNGIWTWNGATSALTRPNEFPSGGVVKRGRVVQVANGTVYGNTIWMLDSTAAGITIDTTAQTWKSAAYVGAGPGSKGGTTGIYVPSDWGSLGGWKTARAAAGSRLVNVVVDGDSIWQGQAVSATLTKSVTWALVNALQALYGDGGSGFHPVADAPGLAFAGQPTVYTVPTGSWAPAYEGLNDNLAVGQSSGSQLQDANVRGTSIDVLYNSGSSGAGSGPFTVSIDGGTAVTVPQAAPIGVARYTVTGLAPGLHTVLITQTTATAALIYGVVGRNSAGILGWGMYHWGRASGAGGTGSPLADPLWFDGPFPSGASFPAPQGFLSAATPAGWSTAYYTYANLYGAGGREILDNVTTSGNPGLTSAAQAQFTAADVGKYVYIALSGTWYPMGTIQSVNSATSITCTVNAPQTTNGSGAVILPAPGHSSIPQANVPDLVVTALSVNDLAVPTTAALYAGNIRTRWDYARLANPNCDLIGVLNAKGDHTDPGYNQHQYARELKALCNEYGAALVDFHALSKNCYSYWSGLGYWGGGAGGTAGNDPVHPGDLGSAYMESVLLPILTG